ncbi:MAG: hypothetical protein LIP28_10735 [Deltaproteobacteria bacterium]|nr:hypothetical protein [Deltaproteobacteria bacterium]
MSGNFCEGKLATAQSITPEDFSRYWGKHSLPAGFETFLKAINTRYREANKVDLEEYIASFIAKVSKVSATRTEEDNLTIFEKGWAEHIARIQKHCDLSALRPKYYERGVPYLLGEGCTMHVCENPGLAADMQLLYVRYLMSSLLAESKTIHEFGSGTAQNLLVMASMAPDRTFLGYEWTDSGVALATMVGQKCGYSISGRKFDMLRPDHSVAVRGDAVLTITSVEQLGENYDAFLEYLLEQKPSLVFHIEPDTTPPAMPSMYHSLAVLYMRLRGYPQAFTQKLVELQRQEKIHILLSRQLPWMAAFGNYRCIAWKPC